MTQLQMKRIVQGISFSPDDPLIPKVKALVRAREFSRVCRLALAAWFEKENRDEVLNSLRRIEQRIEDLGGVASLRRETIPETVYGDVVKDAEGTSAAADALDSY